jgi:hypothetical protein
MKKLCAAVCLSVALTIPACLSAQDRDRDEHHDKRIYDKRHNDYHEWNDREDRAYHMYWEQQHRHYVDWDHANERQRDAYWDWRHKHSDAILKIDIR